MGCPPETLSGLHLRTSTHSDRLASTSSSSLSSGSSSGIRFRRRCRFRIRLCPTLRDRVRIGLRPVLIFSFSFRTLPCVLLYSCFYVYPSSSSCVFVSVFVFVFFFRLGFRLPRLRFSPLLVLRIPRRRF